MVAFFALFTTINCGDILEKLIGFEFLLELFYLNSPTEDHRPTQGKFHSFGVVFFILP